MAAKPLHSTEATYHVLIGFRVHRFRANIPGRLARDVLLTFIVKLTPALLKLLAATAFIVVIATGKSPAAAADRGVRASAPPAQGTSIVALATFAVGMCGLARRKG